MSKLHEILFTVLSVLVSAAVFFPQHASANGANGIPNFREIAPGIFAGGNPIDGPQGTAGFQELVSRNVKIDINLQGTDVSEAPNLVIRLYNKAHEKGEQPEMILAEQALARKAQMQFINLPVNSNNPVSGEVALRIDKVLELMANASVDAPVFVHCEHGADRTGLIVALYRVLQQGISIDQANEEWTRFGHTGKARLFTGELDNYFCKRTAGLGRSRMCPGLN